MCSVTMQFERDVSPLFVLQGSTLRKRKMYEEFLSKVSILGKFVYVYQSVLLLKYFVLRFISVFVNMLKHECIILNNKFCKSAECNIQCRLAHIDTDARCHTGAITE